MLSDNIRNYRKANNLSQDELAEKLDVTRQSISLWENGQTQPTIDNIVALAKIFNVSTDELLKNGEGVEMNSNIPEKKKDNTGLIVAIVIAIAILAIGIVVYLGFFKKPADEPLDENVIADGVEDNIEVSDKAEKEASAEPESKAKPQAQAQQQSKSQGQTQSVSVPEKKFDLYEYCKNFAIEKGDLYGTYSMYQQPSSLYGGYEDEYFAISYWSDYDKVEFCLHCPLDDTYSINFYLTMRGGYNGKYEYLSSRYYRSDGTSVREAKGYIDPAVFSDNYPLGCDDYYGDIAKQDDFMEESRVGICDLIHCLKEFVSVEKMDCDFSEFGFKNY